MTLRVKTFVAPSKIHGAGLYAAEPIKAGTFVWIHDAGLDGWVDPAEMSELDLAHADHFMCWDQKRQRWIRAMDNVNWMNHSDSPNLNTPHKYCHIAARDIAANEELTVNYNEICDYEAEVNLENKNAA